MALLLAACGESPLEPESAATPTISPEQASLSVAATTPSASLDFTGDLEMMKTLTLPSLDDAVAAGKLGLEVDKLSAALKAGNKVEATAAVTAARALLAPGIGGVADLGTIEIVLGNIQVALQ
jgi:hypothetical protein